MPRKINKAASLERVLAVAAERFTTRRFEEVSISEIAMAAHCSNNTIYDVFQTKEGLYTAAIRENARRLKVPSLETCVDSDPLAALVDRCRAWFTFAIDPVTREMFLTIASHSQKLQHLTEGAGTNPHDHWIAVRADVIRAMNAGYLRKLQHDTIVLHIAACITYLPILLHAVWGTDRYKIECDQQIAVALEPMLTALGRKRLRIALGPPIPPTTVEMPTG